MQLPDYGFRVTMDHYANKAKGIDTDKGYLTNVKEFDDDMLSRLQGVVGKLNWLATTGHP